MNFTLPGIQKKLDDLLEHLTSLHGETIYCVSQQMSPERKENIEVALANKVFSFYDIALLINDRFPELRNDKEYLIGVICDLVDQYSDVFRFEGLALTKIENEQRTEILLSKINGLTNLVECNPNLIH